MRLLSRFQTQKPALTPTEVADIQERVRSMHQQIGKRDVELADLFALVGEDERPVLRESKTVSVPELQRFWPDQIPTTRTAAPTPEPAPVYDWRPLPNPNPTTP